MWCSRGRALDVKCCSKIPVRASLRRAYISVLYIYIYIYIYNLFFIILYILYIIYIYIYIYIYMCVALSRLFAPYKTPTIFPQERVSNYLLLMGQRVCKTLLPSTGFTQELWEIEHDFNIILMIVHALAVFDTFLYEPTWFSIIQDGSIHLNIVQPHAVEAL